MLTITDEAAQWFIEEMDLEQGDYVQFFLKIYGGIKTAHPNYFLGMSYGQRGNIGVEKVVKGIHFYFTEEDSWFLQQYNMEIVREGDEVAYHFTEQS